MSEQIAISRAGQELGSWSTTDVQKMLQGGVLYPSDHFWREGMTAWDTLDQLLPPPPPVAKAFPVIFGSAFAVDQLGFVGRGEVRPGTTAVELAGRRLWSKTSRVAVFAVATLLGWIVLGFLTDTIQRAIPREAGALAFFLVACLGLFTLFGTPLLVLTLMPFFCASAGSLRVDRSTMTEVARRGRTLTFLTSLNGKPRRALFRAASDHTAREIEALLRQPPLQTGAKDPAAVLFPASVKPLGRGGRAAKWLTILAGLGFLAFVAFKGYVYLHPSKGPLPPEAIQSLQAFVENDGRQSVAAESVFSMPGAAGSSQAAPADRVKVNGLEYLYPVRVTRPGGKLPVGTVTRLYKVNNTRTGPDGSQKAESRLFYVYKDAADQWCFLENRPAY